MNKRKVLQHFVLLATWGLSPKSALLGDRPVPATVLRIWGPGLDETGRNPLLAVLTKVEAGYRQTHPGVTFIHHLKGNDSALGGLYVGAADLALMDREPSYIELDGYQQSIPGMKPFRMPLMLGGTKAAGHSSPLVIVMNRENPLVEITMAQLNALFNAKPDVPVRQLHTWRDLGLTTAWSDHPIHLHGFGVDSDEAQTFSRLVMSGSRRWVCQYEEYKHWNGPFHNAKEIVEAVGNDRYAIGLTTFDAVSPATRVVAIGNTGDTALPTEETLRSGRYVLGRTVLALARTDESGHVQGQVRDFLEYLMSAKAEAIIAADGSYISLARMTEALQ